MLASVSGKLMRLRRLQAPIAPALLLSSSSAPPASSSSSSSSPPPPPSVKPGQPPHQEMDFFKAADILFTEQTGKRKKFGWDFHLWQCFIACLPPLAVYLIAQYARREARRMALEKGIPLKGEESKDTDQKPIGGAGSNGDGTSKGETVKLTDIQLLKERLEAIERKLKEMEVSKDTKESAPKVQENTPKAPNTASQSLPNKASTLQSVPNKESVADSYASATSQNAAKASGENSHASTASQSSDKASGGDKHASTASQSSHNVEAKVPETKLGKASERK